MTFTYHSPNNSELEAIRYLIQDTDPDQMLLSDEEITWELNFWAGKGGPHFIAHKCCKTIAAKFAREVSFASDSQSISLSELMSKYQALAEQLLADEQSASVGELFVGGEHGASARGPLFALGMHDDPEAGIQDSENRIYPDPFQWGRNVY